MKETFYFSHDYNTRADNKIKRLLAKHGITGYGIFWAIIEDLYNNANALRTDYDCIAYDLRTQSDIIKSIINDFDLFIIDGDTFGSISVERRLNERNTKSEKARISATYRWEKKQYDANALRPQSDSNAIKEKKVKESKIKEKKIKTKYGDSVFLTDDELLKLSEKYGELQAREMIEILDNYKVSKGVKYKDDYRTILNWVVDRYNEKNNKPKPESLHNQFTRAHLGI